MTFRLCLISSLWMIEMSLQTDWNVHLNNWIPFPSLIRGHLFLLQKTPPFLAPNKFTRNCEGANVAQMNSWMRSSNNGPYGLAYATPKIGIPLEVCEVRYHTRIESSHKTDNENPATHILLTLPSFICDCMSRRVYCIYCASKLTRFKRNGSTNRRQ